MAKPLKKNSLATDNRPDQPAFEDPERKERMGKLAEALTPRFTALITGLQIEINVALKRRRGNC